MGLNGDEHLLDLLDSGDVGKVVGDDQPRAVLRSDGTLEALDIGVRHRTMTKIFRDVAITGLGSVFTISGESHPSL